MKCVVCGIIAILLLLPIPVLAEQYSKLPPNTVKSDITLSQTDETAPCQDMAVHDIGNLIVSTGNSATIGTMFGASPDLSTSAVFPANSGNSYLYGACFWVGAIVGEDTLVSVGMDGWNVTREFYPEACPEGYFQRDENDVREHFTAIFYDTLTDPNYVQPDPFENRPHIPLGIKITENSYAWNYPLADDFIILDLTIENIAPNHLQDVYFGIYVDGDVHQIGTDGFFDDIAGFKESIPSPFACGVEKINLAYITDNDGREELPDNECRLTAVTGFRFLYTPSDSTITNFNWWVSNGVPSLDWGPRQEGTPEDPFRDFGGFLGTPEGDRNKYYMLNHPEIDYDQLFSAEIQGPGWWPPSDLSVDLADGADTKYLLSIGPFDLPAGQTLPITLAYIGGENFHGNNCDNFDNLFNPLNPEVYYNTMNFNDLGKNALMAQYVYDNPGVDTDGDGYYGQFRLCGTDTVYYSGDGVPDLDPLFVCGDLNVDGTLNLADVIDLIRYLFHDSPPPPGISNIDFDHNGNLNIMDIIFLINYLYKGGERPDCTFIK